MSGGFRKGHTAAAKITAVDAAEIYRLWNEGGWSQARIARHYHLSETQVGRICRGTSWQSVPRETHHTVMEQSAASINEAYPISLDPELVAELSSSLAKQEAAVTAMPQMPVAPDVAARIAIYGAKSKPAIQAPSADGCAGKGSMDAPAHPADDAEMGMSEHRRQGMPGQNSSGPLDEVTEESAK